MYLVGLHVYYKMIHGPYNVKIDANFFGGGGDIRLRLFKWFCSREPDDCADIYLNM